MLAIGRLLTIGYNASSAGAPTLCKRGDAARMEPECNMAGGSF